MAGMHRQPVAILDRLDDRIDVGDGQLGINALAVEIQRQRHDIDIARAFAIAEQRALDPLGAGQDGELGRGDSRAAIVVRMHRQHKPVPAGDVAAEPFDLVRIDIGRRHLDCCGQVQDRLFRGRRCPDFEHRLADLDRKIELGTGEALRRVLVDDLSVGHCGRQIADQLGTGHRDVDDPGTILPEHDAALQLGGRVVEMHYRSSRPRDGIECSPDQLGARLRQYLDGDILGHEIALDQLAHEIEIRLRSGRKANFDLLEAELDQKIEHTALARAPMGSTSAWLPSRRSTLHQIGARSIVRDGHVRRVNGSAGKDGTCE